MAARKRTDEDRERAGATLAQRLDELKRQQDEFLGTVTHDLRTPLVAVQGFAQLLRASGGLGEKQQAYVDRILQAVRVMNRLMEDLRTARHLDQGRLALDPRPVSLEALAREVLDDHREEAEQKELELRLDAPARLPRALCDPGRLRQAVGNLVQHAIRHAPRGTEVAVRVRVRAGTVRWEVADRGPGFDGALLPTLFQRFEDRGAARGGGGQELRLGLHIARELVGLHGGRVGARNEPAGGACLWAELPLTPPEGEASTPRGDAKP